jgi:hypothetical protein
MKGLADGFGAPLWSSLPNLFQCNCEPVLSFGGSYQKQSPSFLISQ